MNPHTSTITTPTKVGPGDADTDGTLGSDPTEDGNTLVMLLGNALGPMLDGPRLETGGGGAGPLDVCRLDTPALGPTEGDRLDGDTLGAGLTDTGETLTGLTLKALLGDTDFAEDGEAAELAAKLLA